VQQIWREGTDGARHIYSACIVDTHRSVPLPVALRLCRCAILCIINYLPHPPRQRRGEERRGERRGERRRRSEG